MPRIADVARLQAIWTVSPRVSVVARCEHLAAGPAPTKAGYARSDFLTGWVGLLLDFRPKPAGEAAVAGRVPGRERR